MMQIKLYLTLDHIEGPECDEETIIDALCAALGRENGARPAFRFEAYPDGEAEAASIYEVYLADDREDPEHP